MGIGSFLFGKKPGNVDVEGAQRQTKEDIGFLRNARDRDITGLRKSGDLQLQLLEQEKQNALDESNRQRAGLFSSLASDVQTGGGGLSAGGAERLARQSALQGGRDNRSGIFDFSRQATGVRAGDIAAQEDFKDRAAFGVPGLEAQLTQNNLAGQAANIQGKALHSANKRGLIFSAASTMAGGM